MVLPSFHCPGNLWEGHLQWGRSYRCSNIFYHSTISSNSRIHRYHGLQGWAALTNIPGRMNCSFLFTTGMNLLCTVGSAYNYLAMTKPAACIIWLPANRIDPSAKSFYHAYQNPPFRDCSIRTPPSSAPAAFWVNAAGACQTYSTISTVEFHPPRSKWRTSVKSWALT